jgi:hypothetical protein
MLLLAATFAAALLAAAPLTAIQAAALAAAPAAASTGPPPGAAAPPVRIQLAPGASSASLPVELSRGSGVGALTYVLTGRTGQVLEVSLRIPAKDPGVALSVACPGTGHTAIGRAGRLDGSVTMPQTGDYTIAIDQLGPAALPPGVLHVAIKGAPRMIAARPYTGTYYRSDGLRSSVDVQELGGGRLQFSVLPDRGAVDAADSARGPNRGEARGVVELRESVAVFERAGCRLELRFGAAGTGALHVDESGDCGFGPNVTARSDYRRTSLCAAPEAP